MARRPCLVCGVLCNGSRCPQHVLRNGSTRAWRQVRAGVLFRDCYRCALCGRGAEDVDHITPVAAGGTDDELNLRSLCRSCHTDRHAGR